jgi:uncharacterized protein YcbK (DUF882 family)
LNLCLPTSLRRFFSPRKIALLLTVAVLGTAVPSASARSSYSSGRRRHLKLRTIVHSFVAAALPDAALLPEDEGYLPVAGIKYELKLAHAHTGEMVDVVYRVGDTYIPEALEKLNSFLRDSHNQEVSSFDPRTFDMLHTMLAKLGKSNGVVDILSGYRSQETNDALRRSHTTNAAEHSQHIEGKAIDLRVDGVSAPTLRDAAKSIGVGGVGYYPASQFIHVDTGPTREWTFAPRRVRASHRHGRGHRRNRRA